MADPTRIQGPNGLPITTETSATRRTGSPAENGAKTNGAANNPNFAELLRAQQGIASSVPGAGTPPGGVRFSAHAQTRLQSRQIALQPDHLDRLQGAVQRAASKGSRDALVLMDDMAMLVSVANRTVITVVDKDNLKQNVFTNIDSAVIA